MIYITSLGSWDGTGRYSIECKCVLALKVVYVLPKQTFSRWVITLRILGVQDHAFTLDRR